MLHKSSIIFAVTNVKWKRVLWLFKKSCAPRRIVIPEGKSRGFR